MIIRAPRPDSNFYILDKRISEDKRLSWAARGLLIYLLGKPDNWKVSVAALVNEVANSGKPTGRDATYALIDELIKAGYVRREQVRGKDGRVSSVNYIVSETPEQHTAEPYAAEPHTAEPHTAEPDAANPTLTSTEYIVSTEYQTSTDINKNTRTQSARSSKQKSLPCPPDVSQQTFSDWLEVRKAKRAGPVTQTVLDTMRREASKAGISLQEAIEHCCLSGWQGFKAEWYLNSRSSKAEKFDPVAYVNRNRISTQRRNHDYDHDIIDITPIAPKRMA
jgi:hypothetical protein